MHAHTAGNVGGYTRGGKGFNLWISKHNANMHKKIKHLSPLKGTLARGNMVVGGEGGAGVCGSSIAPLSCKKRNGKFQTRFLGADTIKTGVHK